MSFLSSCVFAARSTCWNDKHEKKHNSSKSIDTFRFLSCSVSLSSNKHRLGSLMSQWVLTGSVSFSVFEWSPFVSASRRLSASLYMYSSDLARNSDMLPKTNTNIYLNCFWSSSRQKKKKNQNHFLGREQGEADLDICWSNNWTSWMLLHRTCFSHEET